MKKWTSVFAFGAILALAVPAHATTITFGTWTDFAFAGPDSAASPGDWYFDGADFPACSSIFPAPPKPGRRCWLRRLREVENAPFDD